jgi:predicted GNAT superfamily acetyltransferase
MVIYTHSITETDLLGILVLQKSNLAINLPADEIQSQGFVTVNHSYEDMLKLNNIEQHVIAKENDRVIAYLLAMTSKSKSDIPILIPMFDIFNEIVFANKPVSSYNYIVVGQVCIDKNYRGQGILDACYSAYRSSFSKKYDFAITEIASTNPRSLNAHKRIGFKEIHRYTSAVGTEWVVVLWDWKS